jgi:HAD superfamily hydrolase (TIGR01509 family)
VATLSDHRQEIDWAAIDTLLLDMDGTLLDLAFDNFFWLELVPFHYAELHGIGAEVAVRDVGLKYQSVHGRLAWYCIDHWSQQLGFDIRALKWDHRHLIAYLPGAIEFLRAARAAGKRLRIVTNAHPETLAVKMHQTRLDTLVDTAISSHELDAPKEELAFWNRLQTVEPFDHARTVLVEDSLTVIRTAQAYGVRHTLAIRRPDSRRPARSLPGIRSVDGLGEVAALLDPRDRPADRSSG